MKANSRIVLAVTAGVALGACSSTPVSVPELDTARTAVAQVEASPRAGVAAAQIAEARRALDRADKLAGSGGKSSEVQFEADVATKNAQIANEKITLAQTKDEINSATAERQQVLLDSREKRVKSLEQELQAKKTDRGLEVTLGDVLFDTGKAKLKPGAYSTIDRLANALKEDPSRKVLIEGHTDSTGSPEVNQALSQDRALAVQAALMERGVPGSQITAIGKGPDAPVASNNTASGRQLNRRVDLVFTEDRTRVATGAKDKN